MSRVFLVRKRSDLMTNDDSEDVSPLPVYDRTRTVVIQQEVEIDGQPYVCYECDCYSFVRNK